MDAQTRKAKRKERHQITEKLRRKRINEALATLSELCGLPEGEERALILESAISVIRDLQAGSSPSHSPPIAARREAEAPLPKRAVPSRRCRAGAVSRANSFDTNEAWTQTEPLEVSSNLEPETVDPASPDSKADLDAEMSSSASDPVEATIVSKALEKEQEDNEEPSKLDELLGFLSQQAEYHRAMSHSLSGSALMDELNDDITVTPMIDDNEYALARMRNDKNPRIEGAGYYPTIPPPFGSNEVGHCVFVGVRCVQANDALAKMCGLSDPQQLVGAVNMNFRVREDLVFTGLQLLEYMFGSHRVMKTTERMRRADGSLIWVAAESIRTSTSIDTLPTSSCYIVPIDEPTTGPSASFA